MVRKLSIGISHRRYSSGRESLFMHEMFLFRHHKASIIREVTPQHIRYLIFPVPAVTVFGALCTATKHCPPMCRKAHSRSCRVPAVYKVYRYIRVRSVGVGRARLGTTVHGSAAFTLSAVVKIPSERCIYCSSSGENASRLL